MKKTTLFYSQNAQALAKQRSEERLHAVKMQHLFDKSPKKLSPDVKKRLSYLRDSTVHATLHSLENEKPPVFHFERTGPNSDKPNLGALRHDTNLSRRVVLQTQDGQFHNINPAVLPVTPVKQHPITHHFVSPGGKKYVPSRTTIQLDNNQPLLIPLKQAPPEFSINLEVIKPRVLSPEQTQVTSVKLAYANFAQPAGYNQPINNKKAQGGYSADELAKVQLGDFEKGLITLGLATQEEMQAYLKVFKEIHHEHTHKVASHFGILKNLEKQEVNPRDPLSTFVAPAPLNTEMMLFEKFIDFLLYKNYHKNNAQYREQTVEFTCTLITVPNTTQPQSLKLEIKDLHTGKSFTQTWDKPYQVIHKPASSMYSTLLGLLKKSLDNKSLLGTPVGHVDEENKKENNKPRSLF